LAKFFTMRGSSIATIILFNTKDALAFSPTGSGAKSFVDTTSTVSNYNARQNAVVLHMAEEKKLTAADILARARKKVNRSGDVDDDEGENEPAILFGDDLMDDMKYCLVTLEKRVKEGPGSLTVQEIQEISDASARIVMDMNAETVIEQKISSLSATVVAPPPSKVSSSTPSGAKGQDNANPKAIESVTADDDEEVNGDPLEYMAKFVPKDTTLSKEEYRSQLKDNMSAEHERRRNAAPNRGNQPTKHYHDGLSG